MVRRLWRLLDSTERRTLVRLAPLLVVAAIVEVVGVAAVLPFMAVLADPAAIAGIPLVGPTLAGLPVADDRALLRLTGLALVVVVLTANGLVLLTNWRLYRFSWGLNHGLSSRLLRHYLVQPYAFALTRNSAALANKVVGEVRTLMMNAFMAGLELVARGVVTIAIVAFLIVLDPVLAVIVFAILGGAYGLIFAASRTFVRRIGREAVAANAARLKAVNEALGGFKDLKVAVREQHAFDQYVRPSRRLAEVQSAHQAITALPRYGLEALAISGMVLIAVVMAGRSEAIGAALPLLGAYAFAGLRLLPAIQQIFSSLTRLRFATGALEAVEEDFHATAERSEELPPTAIEPIRFTDSIELEGIRYAYPNAGDPVLDAVSLRIPRRSTVALVGPTGSGKTTIVDVLLGLLEPQSGRITIDGVDRKELDIHAYRRIFGYVPQSIFLLDDSVERNIAFGIPAERIDKEALHRAARLAQVADFIEQELPKGYQTVVGERGVRLSGGQRQRIGIARALYHGPQVLVFDEATSALDVHTEMRLFEAMEEIAQTHTMVTIAHRLESVARADLVVLLQGGKVADLGPPGEVITRYREGTRVPGA